MGPAVAAYVEELVRYALGAGRYALRQAADREDPDRVRLRRAEHVERIGALGREELHEAMMRCHHA